MQVLSNVPPARESGELWNHFSKTYMSLRRNLYWLAFSMPFVLYMVGKFRHGLDLQPSMSAYFWAASQGQCATFPMRTIFVGYLFAIGVSLFAYKGLTNLENSLLNAAALCAVAVAIYPEGLSLADAAHDPLLAQLFENCPAVRAWAAQPSLPIHYLAAVALFVLLAVVAWCCADKSLAYLPIDRNPARFRTGYKLIAVAMVLFPAVGYAFAFLLGLMAYKVFIIEAAGVLTFAFYWFFKTLELKLSSLESDPVQAIAHAERRQAVEMQDDELNV